MDNYVFEDVAKQCAAHLGRKWRDGAFDSLEDVSAFAEALTRELQSVSHDKHMRVRPSAPRPSGSRTSNPVLTASWLDRQHEAQLRCGPRRDSPGHVGILDIRGFPATEPPADGCGCVEGPGERRRARCRSQEQRGRNPGSDPLLCSHFFPPKTHLNSLYWRQGDRTEEFWTLESVEGKATAGPSESSFSSAARTFSGGEEFAYNFKTRKRATLIGETTGGGANPGGMYAVNETLAIFVPTGRAINPVTKTNWRGLE